jgi:hypothetical protein
MKVIIVSAILLLLTARQKTGYPVISSLKALADSVPAMLYGNFMDDYGIRYTVNDSIWIQHPGTQYHIIRWNSKEQYLVARNDLKNHADPGLYTRIDFMVFDNMKPYTWGFCLTVYNAKTDSLAEVSAHADRVNPKKGCAGFPFSRMKRIQ